MGATPAADGATFRTSVPHVLDVHFVDRHGFGVAAGVGSELAPGD